MIRLVLCLAALALAGAAPPPGATNCSGCHVAGVPINGRPAADLQAAMLAYRSGDRASTVMGRLMKGLTPEQIADIATWVSVQN